MPRGRSPLCVERRGKSKKVNQKVNQKNARNSLRLKDSQRKSKSKTVKRTKFQLIPALRRGRRGGEKKMASEFGREKIKQYFCTAFRKNGTNTVDIVQLVRASDCGSECRGFESHYPPSFTPFIFSVSFSRLCCCQRFFAVRCGESVFPLCADWRGAGIIKKKQVILQLHRF